MSSSGVTRETTPLLPWRPAILSPGCNLRFTATNTLTIFITPGGSSSPRCTFSTLLSNRAVMRPTAGVELALQRLDLGHHHIVGDRDVAPATAAVLGQHLGRQLRARL